MSVYDNQYWNDFFNNRENRQINKITGGKPAMFFGDHYFFDIQGNNAIIEKWASKVKRALKQSAAWFVDGKDQGFVLRGQKSGSTHTEGKLAQSIVSKTRMDHGSIDRLTFNFERHGVFVHKGVGRGYKAAGNGFVRRTATGEVTTPRVAVEWFNPVLNQYLPELADKLAKNSADIVVDAKYMKIR